MKRASFRWPARWAPVALASTAAGLGLAVAACGSAGGGPAAPKTSGPGPASSRPAAAAAAPAGSAVKLTGNFCTDLKTVETGLSHSPLPMSSGLATARSAALKALDSAGGEFAALQSEAPGQIKPDIGTVAASYQAAARSVASAGSVQQVQRILFQQESYTTSASSLRQIVAYSAAHC
jgi:hypothetical protein